MRVLFTASRGYTDQDTAWAVLDIIAKEAAAVGDSEVVVVHGACYPRDVEGRQAAASDFIAELWVRRGGHPLPVRVERHPPLYAKYGRRATWVRNSEMVESNIDICLSFEVPGSRGAKGTADMAEHHEITVRRFYSDEEVV